MKKNENLAKIVRTLTNKEDKKDENFIKIERRKWRN